MKAPTILFISRKSVLLQSLIVLCFLYTSCKDSAINNSGSAAKVSEEVSSNQIVSIDEIADLINNEKYRPIDLRTPEEIKESGTIPFSLIMDFKDDDFNRRVNLLDKEDRYILYCKGGGRSSRALKMFNEQGFKNVKEMHAGYDAWAAKFK